MQPKQDDALNVKKKFTKDGRALFVEKYLITILMLFTFWPAGVTVVNQRSLFIDLFIFIWARDGYRDTQTTK